VLRLIVGSCAENLMPPLDSGLRSKVNNLDCKSIGLSAKCLCKCRSHLFMSLHTPPISVQTIAMSLLRTLLTVLLALSFSLQAAGGMARGKCDHTPRISLHGAASQSADDPHKGHHMAGHVMPDDGAAKAPTKNGSGCTCDCSCQIGHCASHGTTSVARSSHFALAGSGNGVRLPVIVVRLTAAHGSGLLRPPSIA